MHALGITEIYFEDETRYFENQPRPLEVVVWYPTDLGTQPQIIEFGIWNIKKATRNAPIVTDQKLPLILFSHGYSGNPWVSTWFAEYLAVRGFMVASVKHYGNSFKNMIPELCARPWNRPQDLSKVLDKLLEHPHFKNRIDKDKMGVAGFSQGGMTGLWLAGAQAHLSLDNLYQQITVIDNPGYRAHFKGIPEARLDRILADFTEQDCLKANQSYRDKRLKAAFAMAPGIDKKNNIFTKEGLAHIDIPTHIVIGEADYLLTDAQFFAHHIPLNKFTLLPGKITHMTLLNEGTQEGQISNPEYTKDHFSVNRAQVHEQTAELALAFFNQYL